MPATRFSAEEVGRRGQELYEQQIRAQVETLENIGKIVVIDIETGAFEISQDGLTANKRALANHPEGTFYGVRVGYEAVESLSGGGLRRVKYSDPICQDNFSSCLRWSACRVEQACQPGGNVT